MNLLSIVFIVLLALTLGIVLYNGVISILLNRYILRTKRDERTGIMKGAEPIHWKGTSNKAVLLIHGFIGSPSDFGQLPKLLHERGYTVKAILLPGHGTNPKEFTKTTVEKLEKAVIEEYRDLKKQYSEVTLVGLSMGGALSILTAVHEKVDRLVLLAPYLKIKHQWFYIFPTEWYSKVMTPLIPYVYRPLIFKQVNRREALKHIVDYDFVPLEGARTCIKIGDKALIAASSLNQPTLVVHALTDKATDYEFSKNFSEALSKKSLCRLVTLQNTNHLVLLDHEKEIVEKEIMDFIESETTLNHEKC